MKNELRNIRSVAEMRELIERRSGILELLEQELTDALMDNEDEETSGQFNRNESQEYAGSGFQYDDLHRSELSFLKRWEIFLQNGPICEGYGWNAAALGRMLPEMYNAGKLRRMIFERADEALPPEGNELLKAFILAEKGLSYASLYAENDLAYLKRAAECLEKALKVMKTKSYDLDWAEYRMKLGKIYYEFNTDIPENKERSIQCFLDAEKIFTREAQPANWAKNQLELGKCYINRIYGERSENLEKAIHSLKNAEKILNRKDFPHEWANIQNFLGNAYKYRIAGARGDNVEKAIGYFQRAMSLKSRQAAPKGWATININLAVAYLERIKGRYPENLEKSIECSLNAAVIYDRKTHPLRWAAIQNNLGTAYGRRIKGDCSENREKAVRYLENALSVYGPDRHPLNWARLRQNLALAYQQRLIGDPRENTLKAVKLLEDILEVIARESYPALWAHIMNNLGCFYSDDILADDSECIEKAIDYFQKALKIKSLQAAPMEWAQTMKNLAEAYVKRLEGDPGKNIDKAIEAYRAAVKIWNRKEFPLRWSMIQHEMGVAYYKRVTGKKSDNLGKAALCMKRALTVRTPEVLPEDCRLTSAFLAKTYILLGSFSKALEYFKLAANADAAAYRQHMLPESRMHEIEEGSALYFNAAWCLTNLGRLEEALEWLERGKTRILSETMTLDKARLTEIPEEDKNLYSQLTDQLFILNQEHQLERREFFDVARDIRKTWTKLNNLIHKIQSYQPHFVRQGLKFQKLTETLPECDTVILEFNITEYGASIFLIRNRQGQTEIKVINEENFKLSDLFRFAADWSERCRQLNRKINDRQGKIRLGEKVAETINDISRDLFQKAGAALELWRPKGLIIIPHMSLHLFPLQLLNFSRNGARVRLFDICEEISFAPSLTVLYQSALNRRPCPQKFAGIANPTLDLVWAEEELRRIKKQFRNNARIISGPEAQIDNVLEAVRESGYVHFACHAEFNPDEPYKSYIALTYDSMQKAADTPTEKVAGAVRFYMPQKKSVHRLYLSDIFSKVKFDANRLVTLSACESGMAASGNFADEFIGFPAAFLYAGAGAVASSLWAVDDEAACLLMEKFYENIIEKNMSIPAALHHAQNDIRKMEEFQNPFFWASFQITGR